MMELKDEIKVTPSKEILIPLSMSILGMSLAFWLSTVSSKADDNAARVQEIRKREQMITSRIFDRLVETEKQLNRIEGKMEILVKRVRNH